MMYTVRGPRDRCLSSTEACWQSLSTDGESGGQTDRVRSFSWVRWLAGPSRSDPAARWSLLHPPFPDTLPQFFLPAASLLLLQPLPHLLWEACPCSHSLSLAPPSTSVILESLCSSEMKTSHPGEARACLGPACLSHSVLQPRGLRTVQPPRTLLQEERRPPRHLSNGHLWLSLCSFLHLANPAQGSPVDSFPAVNSHTGSASSKTVGGGSVSWRVSKH